MNIRVTLASLLVATSAFASAQLDLGTLDSSDGNYTWSGGNNTLDLRNAAVGTWDGISPVPGNGIYDPAKWVVVYKFNNFNIQFGNLNFIEHPSRCPVIILVQGTVSVNSCNIIVPVNVGGFNGGIPGAQGLPGSAGLGPGGGGLSASSPSYGGAGGYATAGAGGVNPGPIYGNPAIVPLIGGSGAGARDYYAQYGGNGGGAILIACKNQMTITNSSIFANGDIGNSGSCGSGGAIKLMAQSLNLPSSGLSARGAQYDSNLGGAGRIRLEANSFGELGGSVPAASTATAGAVAKIFATNLTPKSAISKVGGISTPADPRGSFSFLPDVNLSAAGTQTVEVTCENIPVDGSWSVFVRGVPRNGDATTYTATYATGNLAWSTWTVSVPFTEGNQVLQVRAKKN